MEVFNEANFYNSFYYKKIYINTKGGVSNSLYGDSLGSLYDKDLSEIISNEEFKKIWFILYSSRYKMYSEWKDWLVLCQQKYL